MARKRKSDFTLYNGGSVFVLTPLTPAAAGWIDDNIPETAITWGRGIVIEPRYVEDILAGIEGDRLTVAE